MSAVAPDSFVHLHVHTEYSMLDGASLLDGLFARTSELGMPAIAMTDHGNLHGAYDFYSKAKRHGIKPIIGIEAYITPGTMRGERRRVRWGQGDLAEEGGNDVAGGGAYTHMTMWAESTEGMRNLFRLSSRSSMEGYFYKPRMDKEILAEHSEGLMVSTGCPSGAIQTRLRLGQYDEAVREAGELQDMFGRDSVFLELMDHGIDIEKRVRDDLLRLGKQLSIPPIATNDSHYNNPEDAGAHDALICVASGKRLSDTNRLKFDGGGYYIKSAAEMRELWADRFGMPEACDNTLAIAERCDVEFTESTGGYMARADVPAGETEDSWFRKEVWRGIEARYPGDRLDQGVRDRVEMELAIISQKGYSRLLPRGRRLHQLGQGQRHPRRPRPRLGCRVHRGVLAPHHRPVPPRARAVLRAVPQPRAPLDARLRHRLRRRPPRRGHLLRQRQVRRRARRPDRDVRPAEGQGRHQGRGPRARPRVRDLRPHHQGAAGRRDGQGRPAQGDLQPRAQALPRRRRVPGALRPGSRRPHDLRDRRRPRGPDPQLGRPRGRRDHVERAADRHRPDHGAPAGRRRHHPVRLPDVRVARARQDGLPRPVQPPHARGRAGQHQGQPRRGRRPRGPAASTTGRPTS